MEETAIRFNLALAQNIRESMARGSFGHFELRTLMLLALSHSLDLPIRDTFLRTEWNNNATADDPQVAGPYFAADQISAATNFLETGLH